MPTISVQSKSSVGWQNGANSITLSQPSGLEDNDLLVSVVASSNGTLSSAPAGWSLAVQDQSSGGIYMHYKIASSEPADWTWDMSDGDDHIGVVFRVTGADQSDPLDQTNSDTVTDSSTPTFSNADIDPTTQRSLFVFATLSLQVGSGDDATNHAIVNDNPTWSVEVANTSGVATNDPLFAVALANRDEDTASGDFSFQISNGDSGADSQALTANFNVEPDASVTGTTGVINISANAGETTADANTTGTTGELNITGNTGTAEAAEKDWTATNKSSSSWTPKSKS